MTGPTDRFTVVNILAAVVVTLVSAGLGYYALSGHATGRMGRNPHTAVIIGVFGTVVGSWTVVKGIRSRRR